MADREDTEAVIGESREPTGARVPLPDDASTTGLARPGVRATISLVAFAVAWEAFARLTPAFVAPRLGTIASALLDIRIDFALITFARVLVALLASFVLGLLGAIILSALPRVLAYLNPIVKLIMAVPAICWVMFTVLWFTAVETRIAFVLIIVCAPIYLVDILDAMHGVPKQLRDMVNSFRPTRFQYYKKLMLPATVPMILTSWKVNLSIAIRVVTIAELVGAVSGIGYGLTLAQQRFSVAAVFAWTIVLVVFLLATLGLVTQVERRLLRWREA